MNRFILFIFILFVAPKMAFGQLFPNLGGQRAGISSAHFLKIGVGARSIGMGESYVAVADDIEALYWNPAGITLFNRPTAFFSHAQWVVDVQMEYAGFAFNLGSANSFGVAVTYLHTEDMKETTELQPFGTGRSFSFGDFLAAFTYGRKMTDKFSFGLTVKYMYENIADITMSGLLFDLGTHYNTGWKSTRFAVALSHFGPDLQPSGTTQYINLDNEVVKISDFQSFAPPTVFRIGVAGELVDNAAHRITTSVQLNHPNDNAENINLGMEYWWNRTIALRIGYKTAQVEESFSAGFGLHFPITMADFKLDYAYTNFGRLGTVNRFAIQLQF
jgi:hypothetical protein